MMSVVRILTDHSDRARSLQNYFDYQKNLELLQDSQSKHDRRIANKRRLLFLFIETLNKSEYEI